MSSLFFFNRYFWPDTSASSQMLTDLAVHLAAAGHDVTVVTSRQRQDDAGAALPVAENHRDVAVRRLRTTTFGRQRLAGRALDYVSFYVAAACFVLARVGRGDTVVAKTDPPLLGAALSPFVALKRARLINWWQDVYPEAAEKLGVLRQGSWLAGLLRWLRNRSLRAAACNVAIGERMREYLQTFVAPDRLRVIPNWSQPLEYTPAPLASNPYRQQLGMGESVVFCFSGNLGRAHRFEALLEVGKRLRGRTDLRFLIIGDGPQLGTVKSAARDFANWSFLPLQPREQLADSLGAADVHLISLDPALEGLIVPSKIYGVLAAGRPCLLIGAADGEIARMLREHDCGETVSPHDAAALATAITRLAADIALRGRMGANAEAASHAHYNFRHVARQWEKVLGNGAP